MKKKVMTAIITACCMSMSMPTAVWAAKTDATAEVETSEETSGAAGDNAAAENDTNADADSRTGLSDNIYDFQIEIQGELYQFPMSYTDFTALGWSLSDREDPEMTLTANSYGGVYFNKGELSVRAQVINLGVNEVSLAECLVGGISIDGGTMDADLISMNINLPKGITMGKSSLDDIRAAYGDPSDTYEGDLYTKYTYQKDFYQDVELYVFKEDNTLREVSIRNFTEPEGFDKGGVSGETPEIVTAYTEPDKLGSDMLDPVVEFCGDLYQLPCPVTALQDKGWELLDVTEEDFVAGGSIGFVDMMRNNQKVHFSVYNLTENAVTIENCFVTELKAATYDAESITIKLSGDITLGAEKADLIAAAEAKGYPYQDEDGYLTVYKDESHKLETRIEFWFNKDESETAAASITYRNEKLAE